MTTYSIIIPAYNEEKTLRLFYDAAISAFDTLQEEYELIFVNDGSTDGTRAVLKTLAQADKRVKVCNFSRNFGQQAALLCGMQHAQGKAVIVMDADLQDPPEVALKMIEEWKKGYEVVHGKRRKRKGETLFKKTTAKFFYGFTRKITGMRIQRNSGDFKLYDRKVVDAILAMPEHDRLLRAQVAWVGFSQTCVEFDRPERVAGSSHYTLKKMFRLAQAGIFPNTEYTLTFPIKLGVAMAILSLACFAVFIALTCCKIYFGGLTAWLFPTATLLTSVIVLCQGMANMHIHMIYKEVQNRPKYILTDTFNIDGE